jgi:hypothetical protein
MYGSKGHVPSLYYGLLISNKDETNFKWFHKQKILGGTE